MSMSSIKHDIIDRAKELGFLDVRFARAEYMNDESERLREWLGLGYHGKMGYMANHFEKRIDPAKLVPGARTVISLAYNLLHRRET